MNKNIETVVTIFGPQLNKLLGLIIFFYASVIVMNTVVYFTLEPGEPHPTRLTDIFSDAGTLSLGAYLGILKEKADAKRKKEEEPEDEFDDFDGAPI